MRTGTAVAAAQSAFVFMGFFMTSPFSGIVWCGVVLQRVRENRRWAADCWDTVVCEYIHRARRQPPCGF